MLYDLTEWPAGERDRLDALLDDGGVPHRYEDEGETLVVATRDEKLVETLLDQAENPDALDVEADGDGDEASSETLSGFFLAADRLRRDPLDPDGIAALLEVIDVSENTAPPFGVSATLWQNMIDEADLIADSLAEDDIDIAKVVEHALRAPQPGAALCLAAVTCGASFGADSLRSDNPYMSPTPPHCGGTGPLAPLVSCCAACGEPRISPLWQSACR